MNENTVSTITDETPAPLVAPAPVGPAAKLGCWMTPERTRTMLLRTALVQVGGAILGAAVANLALAVYQGPEPVGTEAEQAAYAAYSVCLADMTAARKEWEATNGKVWNDPATCFQPTVSYGDYRRAYAVAWVDYAEYAEDAK